jgi:hypothetical protein
LHPVQAASEGDRAHSFVEGVLRSESGVGEVNERAEVLSACGEPLRHGVGPLTIGSDVDDLLWER